MIPRSPTPPRLIRERQLSVSSRSSLTGEVHQRRKVEVESPQDYLPTPASPPYPEDFDAAVERKKRKKKEKKHKKEKKNKKKKKKKQHRSRSTTEDSDGGGSDSDRSRGSSSGTGTAKKTPPLVNTRRDGETLSDWEHADSLKQPVASHQQHQQNYDHNKTVAIDTSACSPVSNDSRIGSPEPVYEVRSPTPSPVTPPPEKPYREYRDYGALESPHTPPIHHSR